MIGADIWRALHDFKTAHLYEGAIQLLRTLGLQSDKALPPNKRGGTLDNFLRQFENLLGDVNLTTKERDVLQRNIREVVFIFQITNDDVCFQQSELVKSIYFVSADIIIENLTPLLYGDLCTIVKALNKLFGAPVVVLFRYKNQLALGTSTRREHLRRPERDVLPITGVTMDIDLEDPEPKHKDFLLGLKNIITSDHDRTLADIINYLVCVPNQTQIDALVCRRENGESDALRAYIENIFRVARRRI